MHLMVIWLTVLGGICDGIEVVKWRTRILNKSIRFNWFPEGGDTIFKGTILAKNISVYTDCRKYERYQKVTRRCFLPPTPCSSTAGVVSPLGAADLGAAVILHECIWVSPGSLGDALFRILFLSSASPWRIPRQVCWSRQHCFLFVHCITPKSFPLSWFFIFYLVTWSL